jgi:hypothetical protein
MPGKLIISCPINMEILERWRSFGDFKIYMGDNIKINITRIESKVMTRIQLAQHGIIWQALCMLQ